MSAESSPAAETAPVPKSKPEPKGKPPAPVDVGGFPPAFTTTKPAGRPTAADAGAAEAAARGYANSQEA